MSKTPEQLLKLMTQYATAASQGTNLVTEGEAVKTAEKKKLDPKAKVRNRGTVCVPAENAKDKQDHFPINDEGQARSALSRVEGLSSAPWYNGTVEGLKALVKKKVHAKFPGIGKDKKTSKKAELYISDSLLERYSQNAAPSSHIRAWDPSDKETKPENEPSINHVSGNVGTDRKATDAGANTTVNIYLAQPAGQKPKSNVPDASKKASTIDRLIAKYGQPATKVNVIDRLIAKYGEKADDELEANSPEIQEELEAAKTKQAPAPFVDTPKGQAQAPVVKRPPAYAPPPDYKPEPAYAPPPDYKPEPAYAPPPDYNPNEVDFEIDDVKASRRKGLVNKLSQLDFLLKRYSQDAPPRQALTFQRGNENEEIVDPPKPQQEVIEFPANAPKPVKPAPAKPVPVPPKPTGYAKENIDPWTGKRWDPNMQPPNVKHTKSSDFFDRMITKYSEISPPVAGYQVSAIQSALQQRDPNIGGRLSQNNWGEKPVDGEWGSRTEDAFSTWSKQMNLPIGTKEQRDHAVEVLMSGGGQTPTQPGKTPPAPGVTPPAAPAAPVPPAAPVAPSSDTPPGTTPPLPPEEQRKRLQQHHQRKHHQQQPGQVPPPPPNAPPGGVPDYYPPNQPPPPPYGAPQGQPQYGPPGQPEVIYEQGPGGVVPGYGGGVYPAGFGGRFQPGYGRGRPPGHGRVRPSGGPGGGGRHR